MRSFIRKQDVEGWDACRKIAILTSLASGNQVDFHDIYTEGITKVTSEDFAYAKKMGCAIKLLAVSKKMGETYCAMVAPALIRKENPLYMVNDVFNAVCVEGNMLGVSMFYGSGAGQVPTASAVAGDMVDAAQTYRKSCYHLLESGEAYPGSEGEDDAPFLRPYEIRCKRCKGIRRCGDDRCGNQERDRIPDTGNVRRGV